VNAKGDGDPYTVEEALKSLEQAYSRPPRETPTRSRSQSGLRQADVMVDLAERSGAELFRETDGIRGGFVTATIQGHPRTLSLDDPTTRHWLAGLHRGEKGRVPGRTAVDAALNTLRAMAAMGEVVRDVWIRVAEAGGRVYLDLADAEARVVEVAAEGWKVLESPPAGVKFVRPPGTLPLPIPTRRGTLDDVRPFLNVSDDDFLLAVAWLLSCFRPNVSSPVLLVSGEQGSAKTTACRTLRSLVDPNAAPLRSLPRNERDLLIAASNAMILGFDNVSFLEPWMSDALCRIATGAGFATRALWTNSAEQIFSVRRPVIMNGIEDGLITRSDLLDRSIIVFCEAIPDHLRRTESAFNANLDAARPQLLGSLLDCVAVGLKNRHAQTPERLPRMADFAVWTVSTVPDRAKRFWDVYDTGRAMASESVVESSPVIKYLVNTVQTDGPYIGTAGDLLDLLNDLADEKATERKDWPRTPRKLAGILRRLAPDLRRARILNIEPVGRRIYRITECERSLKKDRAGAPPADDVENGSASCEINKVGGSQEADE